MPEQQVVWTALPREASASELVLDVFVSPRLGIDAATDRYTLADFPEFEHWPNTLQQRLTFSVEFADGSVHAAQVMPTPLDADAWDHIFPATTFVRPWSFKDLSQQPIYSPPLRFVTAYLRDLYQEVGRTYATAPPTRDDLSNLRQQLGGITDVRVDEERKPPPRQDRDLPPPHGQPTPRPNGQPQGCLAALCRLLRPLSWLLHPIRIWLGLPPLCKPTTQPPPDPTTPKIDVPRTVYPSPYQAVDPIPPAQLPKLAALEQQMAANKVVPPSPEVGAMTSALATRDTALDFIRVMRFYERPENQPPPGGWPPPPLPELDFHQALAALADYQSLLRTLGLLVQLRLPRPAANPGSIRVVAAWDGVGRASDLSPHTRCDLAGDRFAAAHQPNSDLDHGMLDLTGANDRLASDTPKFDLIEVDADGAAIKAVLQAASLERTHQLFLHELLALDLRPAEPTPALRTGGLAIIRPDRAAQLHDKLVTIATNAAPQPAPTPTTPTTLPNDLFAEDLVRGYRVEVSEDGGTTWRSLCWRIGHYRLVDDTGKTVRTLPQAIDEGYVKASSATSNGGATDPLYVHEALVRWTGWSLCVPRPGRTLEPATAAKPRPAGEPYEKPELPNSDPTQTQFHFAVEFRPKPGSLPRLRFGNKYRLRVLCVDLSGEPLDKPTTTSPSSDEITYRRFEPASPPALLPLRRFTPGESLERLVLRSDYDRDNPTWDAQEMSGTAADAAARRTRHVFPPKTSQEMVEVHGKLDHAPFSAFGPGGQPDAGYRLSLREQGTFNDNKIIDIHTVDIDQPVATITFGSPEEIRPANASDPGSYVINHSDTTLPMPYLPDPAVAGVALRGVPGLIDHVTGTALTVHNVDTGDFSGQTEPLLEIPLTGTWPDLEPLRLRIAEAAAPTAPNWDGNERLLTIYLQKAEQAEIRYSSYLGAGELDHHGVWDWLGGDPAGTLREQAQVGAHWMISPPRTLALVHAVQRPLTTAHFSSLQDPVRQLAETTAELKGKLKLDVASTGRIDVIGHWQEWRDPVDGNDFDERQSVACDFIVNSGWGDTPDFPPPPKPGETAQARHEFGDTKHRFVHYGVRATTAFREYLDPNIDPAKLARDSTTAELVKVNVKSTARPDPPGILYAVPTFGWPNPAPAAGWPTHTSERVGGGLRVYLDRPWYSSGEGELLAVVLQAHEANTLPFDHRSSYGADLIWQAASEQPVTELLPTHFPNRADEDTGLSLAGDEGFTGTVAAFKPEWDTQRALWFCDIEIDTSTLPWTYWPFLRFAFVRYQRHSFHEKVKLSKIVIGEFAQIAPNRSLSLSWQGNQKLTATLTGHAPTAPQATRVAYRIQTTAVPPGAEADELDWDHASGHDRTISWQNFNTLIDPTGPDPAGNMTWTQTIDLPSPRGTKRMRIEVAEYEFLLTDPDLGEGIPRLTYAAHVPLD
jgi:hypothetical protein